MLSQVLAILYAYDTLPPELLAGGLADPVNQPFPLRTRVAEPRQSGSPEFWSSIGGSYKASLDWSVILSCDSGAAMERGPEVRVQTLRMRQHGRRPRERGGSPPAERGRARRPRGRPLPDAWIVLLGGPGWVAADEEGRFMIGPVRAGTHRLRARTPDGREAEVNVAVPGPVADVIVGGAPETQGVAQADVSTKGHRTLPARLPARGVPPRGSRAEDRPCARRRPADPACSWATWHQWSGSGWHGLSRTGGSR